MKNSKRILYPGNINKISNYSAEIKKVLVKYPQAKARNLIPILRDIQNEFGYLSRENLIIVSNYLNLPFKRILGVASFYNQFKLKPVGKNIIKVCRGRACHAKGSDKILEHLKSVLNLQNTGTTEDRKFTLESVACLKACSTAPVIGINDEFFGRFTIQDVDRLINNCE